VKDARSRRRSRTISRMRVTGGGGLAALPAAPVVAAVLLLAGCTALPAVGRPASPPSPTGPPRAAATTTTVACTTTRLTGEDEPLGAGPLRQGLRELALPQQGGPTGMVPAPDGGAWFVEEDGSRIDHVTPAGALRVWRLPASA